MDLGLDKTSLTFTFLSASFCTLVLFSPAAVRLILGVLQVTSCRLAEVRGGATNSRETAMQHVWGAPQEPRSLLNHALSTGWSARHPPAPVVSGWGAKSMIKRSIPGNHEQRFVCLKKGWHSCTSVYLKDHFSSHSSDLAKVLRSHSSNVGRIWKIHWSGSVFTLSHLCSQKLRWIREHPALQFT